MSANDDFFSRLYRAPARRREAAQAAAEAVLDGHPEAVLVNQADATRLLSVSRFTIRRLVMDGQLRPVQIRGLTRYRRSDLLKLAGEVVS